MARARKNVRKRTKGKKQTSPLLREISAVFLLAAAIFLAFSLWRQAEGMGLLGLTTRAVLVASVGTYGSQLLVLAMTAYALRLLFVSSRERNSLEALFAITLLLSLITGLQLWQGVLPISAWGQDTAGGFVGNALVWTLASLFGSTGAWIVLGGLTLGSLLGLTGVSLVASLASARKRGESLWQDYQKREQQPKPQSRPETASFNQDKPLILQDFAQEEAEEAAPIEIKSPSPDTGSAEQEQVAVEPEAMEDWDVEQVLLPQPDYQKPSLGLLNKGFRPRNLKQNRDIYDNIHVLESTLDHFGIKAKVVQATKGPAVTRYEIQTAPGTKVSRVTSLADDIALSLACSEVRIEAPIPGKAAIGIEVPNKAVSLVLLRDVLESPEFTEADNPLAVGLGKDIAGKAIVADLGAMPHVLIAGATGSGKSVCINSLILSLLYKSTPEEVRFLMVDPKVVELSSYNGIPHLLAPVVNHPKKAALALKWATNEMEKRYGIFAKAGVRDITRYNESAVRKGKEKLPYIVIIIDELADLMMVARADVEDAICRLAQMARAAGMHLVIGTQRPSTDVITGLIKANIPSRISFAVSSATDSRVILDMGGAEKLLGKGDMLFAPVGVSKPLRVQGAYVTNREIESVVDFVGSQAEAQYVETLSRIEEVAHVEQEDERDELFDEAVRVVAEAGQASVSLLQRRLRVGYTRAARLIDQLEAAGAIGPYEGSKPRQVYKNRDIIKNLLESGKKPQTM